MRVIVLEGGVASGKSSAAGALRSIDGCRVLPDYADMIHPDEMSKAISMPPRQRFDYFLELEKVRARLLRPGDRVVVMDRSVCTMLAHEYALLRLGMVPNVEHVSVVPPPLSLDTVDVLTYLTADGELRRNRARLRATRVGDLFLDEEFNRWFEFFFRSACRAFNILILDSGQLPADTIAARSVEAADSGEYSVRLSEFWSFFRELSMRASE